MRRSVECRGRFVSRLWYVEGLPYEERARLSRVETRYPFRATEHYLSLIDWSDPNDPLRRLVVPHEQELAGRAALDACDEAAVTVAPGVQHKYRDTALLLCSEHCAAYCRYCFRKRLFMDGADEVSADVAPGLDYIRRHPEITNVLLTGGDSLMLPTRRLLAILRQLDRIPHVRIVRLGSKVPAFDPCRILDDPELIAGLRDISRPDKRLYLMCHFDHPRELVPQAVRALDCFISNGVLCANQCPLVRGVNDDPAVLAELFRRLSYIGVPPYYVFQMRPTAGNRPYRVPIVEGWGIFSRALRNGSGLAGRARMVMSHASGKIEILAVDQRHIYLRYHRAKDPAMCGRVVVCHRDDHAYWYDDLHPLKAPPAHGHHPGAWSGRPALWADHYH